MSFCTFFTGRRARTAAAAAALAILSSTDLALAGISRPGLVSYYNFDEADRGTALAVDRAADNDGLFQGTASRVPGLLGTGAARFNNTVGDAINVGTNFSATAGISLEALITSEFRADPAFDDEDHIFRKEDSDGRILLAFDQGADFSEVPVGPGPVLSFGLNVGGTYGELNMPLDGQDGRPSVEEITAGVHHIVATYDGATGRKAIYIDGTERFATTLSGSITSGGPEAAYIGNGGQIVGFDGYAGEIDEFAFYDRALSPAEIGQHFRNVQTGNSYFVPLPAAIWPAGALLAAIAARRALRPEGRRAMTDVPAPATSAAPSAGRRRQRIGKR